MHQKPGEAAALLLCISHLNLVPISPFPLTSVLLTHPLQDLHRFPAPLGRQSFSVSMQIGTSADPPISADSGLLGGAVAQADRPANALRCPDSGRGKKLTTTEYNFPGIPPFFFTKINLEASSFSSCYVTTGSPFVLSQKIHQQVTGRVERELPERARSVSVGCRQREHFGLISALFPLRPLP